jgi:hypothetical protein
LTLSLLNDEVAVWLIKNKTLLKIQLQEQRDCNEYVDVA